MTLFEKIEVVLRENSSPLTTQEITSWSRIKFYLKDSEIEDNLDEWAAWIHYNVKAGYRFTTGAYTYSSGKRFVTFFFEKEEDAALFRLFCGGNVVES
jgi:hypothetical protein